MTVAIHAFAKPDGSQQLARTRLEHAGANSTQHMLSGLLLIPTVVVVGNVAVPTGGVLIAVAIVAGVLAGLVRMLGLLRWV